MSRGLVCDNCQSVLELNNRGDADNGEHAAWLRITTGSFGTTWDACSRSCAVQLIDDGPIRKVLDDELEIIASIMRTIADDRRADNE